MGEVDKAELDRLRRAFDAVAAKDWDAAGEFLHPEIEWHQPPDAPETTVSHGREEVRRFFEEQFDDAWESWSMEFKEMIPCGKRVLSHVEISGIGRASGIETHFDMFQVWSFKDGLVIEQRAFFDRESALKAAGREPEDGQPRT